MRSTGRTLRPRTSICSTCRRCWIGSIWAGSSAKVTPPRTFVSGWPEPSGISAAFTASRTRSCPATRPRSFAAWSTGCERAEERGSRLPDVVGGILRRQLGVGISFVTTLTNLATADLPEEVVGGWKSYFFGESGFQTVDGIEIIAPGHSGLLGRPDPGVHGVGGAGSGRVQAGPAGLRGLLNERSGEQYVRISSASSSRWAVTSATAPRPSPRADGSGAGPGQGHALVQGRRVDGGVARDERRRRGLARRRAVPDESMLAASAATYAGTAARKATQHAFLSHIPIPLR